MTDYAPMGPGWLPRSERYARGKLLRQTAKRRAHADWRPAQDRIDPVAILREQGRRRIPELLPILQPLTADREALRGPASGILTEDGFVNPAPHLPVWASNPTPAPFLSDHLYSGTRIEDTDDRPRH